MSTKKRDVPLSKTTNAKVKAKKPEVKKEIPKSSSRAVSKKADEEEEKKKRVLKPRLSQNVTRKPIKTPAKTGAKPTSNRLATPPSTRVTKSQFFPSKQMYSNALKTESTSQVKPVSDSDSSISERPRTATLRKGSIVNKNIAGPDAPKAVVKVEEPEYEDDFDSYESDFEAYSSSDVSTTSSSTESDADPKSPNKRVSSAGTDDEKKLDSGNYELPESRHKQILDNIKESIEKENANLNFEHRSNLASLSDEGFEDENKAPQFINFLGAHKKYKQRKSVQLRRKRGEEILSMIKLDLYSFTLFNFAPVPYDIFIKSFGKTNSVQASVQTGDDDLNEETQTEEIQYCNKWTQCPPHFSKLEETGNNWGQYKANYLGVGGDILETYDSKTNESELEKFLINTGNLIINLQAETNIQTATKTTQSNLPFSKGFILYETKKVETLQHGNIKDVCFCYGGSTKILTAHWSSKDQNSALCLWNMSNVKDPEIVLSAFGEIICTGFNPDCPNLIFGGFSTGCLAIWDLKEDCRLEIKYRSPTYSTEINYGHCSKIVSIQPMLEETRNESIFVLHNTAAKVCSLDEEGEIVVWSVIFTEQNKGQMVEHQGLAHWGSVILTINTKISLSKLYPEIDDFRCTDLTLSAFDCSNFFIATNYGIIVHCLANGGKTSVKKFLPGTKSPANCLEMCPFSSEYFLAGFDNGDVNFYSRVLERPLMTLSNVESVEGKSRIDKVQWSHNRPLVLYTKDAANTIHVWNLVSDMFPVCSIPFKDNVLCMKLSPPDQKTYMVIATENGLVYVHLLNEDHGQQPAENFEKEQRRFLNYIKRFV